MRLTRNEREAILTVLSEFMAGAEDEDTAAAYGLTTNEAAKLIKHAGSAFVKLRDDPKRGSGGKDGE